MYKRIIVAVDGSEVSDRGFAEALRIAREDHAALRVVHVVDVIPPGVGGDGYVDLDGFRKTVVAKGQQVLDEARAAARDSGVDAEYGLVEVEMQALSGGILSDAHRWGADLIVIGTHGHGGLRNLLGSVAEGVVRHADLPVLLIHAAR